MPDEMCPNCLMQKTEVRALTYNDNVWECHRCYGRFTDRYLGRVRPAMERLYRALHGHSVAPIASEPQKAKLVKVLQTRERKVMLPPDE
jgi:hypothetical protein